MERLAASARSASVIAIDEGVELRPVRLGDASALFAAVDRNRDRLRQWLPWVGLSYSFDDMCRFLMEREHENATRAAFTTGIWAGGELCGAVGLHRIETRHRNTSIGYWIDGA